MDATNAGGRNTQTLSSPGVTSLEIDLHNVADAIAALLADARAIDPAQDEYGHARSRAYTDAVALLNASAKVGHTIAEMRGSKFEHNINVRRHDVGAAASSDSEDEGTLIRFGEDTLWDWKTKETFVLDRSRGPDGRPARAPSETAATPLPISGGSNGNFEAPGCDGAVSAVPKVRNL
jgi:hypothetical protein